MGIRFTRNKKRHFLLSFLYRFDKIIPVGKRRKLSLYLDLEWIFNRLSHEYSFKYFNEKNHPVRVNSYQYILDEIKETDSVLDLGCAFGAISYALSKKARNVTGIDYSKSAIEIANKKYKGVDNLNFVCCEAYDYLKNEKVKYDVLILSHILEHLDNPEDFLTKFSPFFSRIYIEVPDFEASYLNIYRQELNLSLNYTDNDHISEFDRMELLQLTQKCRLSVLKAEYRFGIQKIWCVTNS